MVNGGSDYQSQNGYRSSRPITPATSRPSASRPITPVSYIHEPSVKNYQPVTPPSQRHIMMQEPQEGTRVVGTLTKKQTYKEPAGSINSERQELILQEPINGSRVGTLTRKQSVSSERQLPAAATYPNVNNAAQSFVFKEPQIPLQPQTGYPQKSKSNQKVYSIEPQDAVYSEAQQPFIPRDKIIPSSNVDPAEIPMKAQQYAPPQDRPESSTGSSNEIIITMRSNGNANNPGVTSMTEPLVPMDPSRNSIRSIRSNNAVTIIAGGQILNTDL